MGKNSSNDLFQLIKSLKSVEKVYFKTFVSSKNKSEQLYIRIFDAIDRQTIYNEKKILKKFHALAIKRSAFFTSKKYLSHLIFKSLESFHSKNSIKSQIIHLINIADILYEKRIYSTANKKIEKAKQLAYKYEYFLLLIDVLSMERKIIGKAYEISEQKKMLEKNFKEIENALTIYDIETTYANFAMQMNLIFQKTGVSRSNEEIKQMRDIIENPMFQNENNATSFHSKYHLHTVLTVYYHNIPDFIMAHRHSHKLVEIMDKSPHQIQDKPILYLRAVANLLSTDMPLFLIDEFWVNVKKIMALPPKSENVKIEKLTSLLYVVPAVYITTGQFKEGHKMLSDFSDEYGKNYYDVLLNIDKINFFYAALYLCFGAKQYSDALKWIRLIFDVPAVDARRDYYTFTKLFNILVHFEMGNWEVLESLIMSTHRHLGKVQISFKFERIVLKYMNKLFVKHVNVNIPELFIAFKKELLTVFKDANERKVLENFDILSWVESKIEGKSFAEIIKEKAKLKSKLLD